MEHSAAVQPVQSSGRPQPEIKQEDSAENVEVELDVSGDTNEEVVVTANQEPSSSFGPPRVKRLRRYPARYVENNVEYHEEPTFEHEMELELDQDVRMIRRESHAVPHKPYTRQKTEYGDYGLVDFKFDSSQRKRHVIVYNSRKYPGHASEWYFARKNATTLNETYRCVQCRRYREEVKRGVRQDEYNNKAEARIIVHQDRFLTDPDEPLGDHICNFEHNERTLMHQVWTRRALSKANSELRISPAKPKSKFKDLVDEIKSGQAYAHLPEDVRDKIVDELMNSGKGFDSRRRSFARNNRLAQERMAKKEEYYDDDQIMHYCCGMPRCDARFETAEERAKHRTYTHPGVLFIDSNEDLKNYQLGNNVIQGDELIVADEQEIASTDGRVYRHARGELDVGQYEVIHGEQEELNEDQQRYLDQVEFHLSSIKQHAIDIINEPSRREQALEQLNSLQTFFEDIVVAQSQVQQPPPPVSSNSTPNEQKPAPATPQ
ncbi:unnamed protein product [Bursaphelenchus xylophilus]|uniref:(pine wood nematode) hypothetical protein n=1 Tax=Bursaphelenchus xylophilus TaxID=6326 RepID=A0A1I7SWZ3_BURXY|nr:unnamed protein product [Bursaphelenchus xylophilus]CAG9100066.1 unnamed protein product [Bursaphelenchus xylophilus]